MDLFERLDAAGERWNVLRHSFYRRWSEGGLERKELAFYAGEYRHAVVALAAQATAAAGAAEPALAVELEQHAGEEAAHVDLWDDFVRALEADGDRAPLPETARCADAWTAGEGLLERLMVLYAVESAQPAISEKKLEGLVTHYGMAPDAPGAAYFALHAERDRDHADHSRRLIAARLDGADRDRLVGVAESALEGNWCLLDGVEARFVGAAG